MQHKMNNQTKITVNVFSDNVQNKRYASGNLQQEPSTAEHINTPPPMIMTQNEMFSKRTDSSNLTPLNNQLTSVGAAIQRKIVSPNSTNLNIQETNEKAAADDEEEEAKELINEDLDMVEASSVSPDRQAIRTTIVNTSLSL